MQAKMEQRYVMAAAGQEVRVMPAEGGKPAKITGYAAVYNSLSEDLGGFREMVMPGAFAKALADKPDVRGMYNHERILSRTKAGTLRLADDAVGLRYEMDVPETSTGRDVAECIRRGDVDGSSFCFRVIGTDGESWRKSGETGGPIRELRRLELLDVGPVDSPAYAGTEGKLSVRSLPNASQKELVKLLWPAAARSVLPAGVSFARPFYWAARMKLAEIGGGAGVGKEGAPAPEKRFYLDDDSPESALADACRQAASACDSMCSLCWKLEDADGCRAACIDCLVMCQALSQVVCNDASAVAGELAGVTGQALRTCAKACKAIEHPVAALCQAVCLQAADQCDMLAGG